MVTTTKAAAALDLNVGEAVVYPSRGVGRITAIEEQEAAGFKLEVYVISFDRENATIKIPTSRAAKQGLRKVSDAKTVDAALEVMTGRARKSKTMWSRRAQELEAKVNSGDLLQMAEVARDLHRLEGESEASFSERGIYDTVVALIAQEVAVLNGITEAQATALIRESLDKSPPKSEKGAQAEDRDGGLEQVA